MYVIKNNDGHVIWGPKIWDRSEMQSKIYSYFNINFPIQWANPNEKVIQINDEGASIWPVIFRNNPDWNKKTQKLDGPFYDYSDTHAEQYYTAIDMTLDEVKNNAKNVIDEGRNIAIGGSTPVTVNGTDYLIDVSKEQRHNYSSGIPGNWQLKRITSTDTSGDYDTYETAKEWVTLTQDNLDTIDTAIKDFIQEQFDINKSEHAAIDAFTSTDDILTHTFPDGRFLSLFK